MKKDSDEITLILTRDESRILENAMNEANEALDDTEFSTRMGVQRPEMQRLQKQFRDL